MVLADKVALIRSEIDLLSQQLEEITGVDDAQADLLGQVENTVSRITALLD